MDVVLCEIASSLIGVVGELAYRWMLAIPVFGRRTINNINLIEYYKELSGHKIITRDHWVVYTRHNRYHRRDGPAVYVLSNDWKTIIYEAEYYDGCILNSTGPLRRSFKNKIFGFEFIGDTTQAHAIIKTIEHMLALPKIRAGDYSSYDNTSLKWRVCGLFHNVNGPSIINKKTGEIGWYINGELKYVMYDVKLATDLYNKYVQ